MSEFGDDYEERAQNAEVNEALGEMKAQTTYMREEDLRQLVREEVRQIVREELERALAASDTKKRLGFPHRNRSLRERLEGAK